MKLESLKSDKFSPFKENEIQNAIKIIGGERILATTRDGNPNADYYSSRTEGPHIGGDGQAYDWFPGPPPASIEG